MPDPRVPHAQGRGDFANGFFEPPSIACRRDRSAAAFTDWLALMARRRFRLQTTSMKVLIESRALVGSGSNTHSGLIHPECSTLRG